MGKVTDIRVRREGLSTLGWERRDLTDGGFFCVDNEFIDQYARECGNHGSLIYMALCRYAGKDQTCFPGVVLLEKMLGISRKSVIRGLGELEKRGIIKVSRVKGRPNIYTLVNKSIWGRKVASVEPKFIFEGFVGMCGSCSNSPDGCSNCIGGVHWVEREVVNG